MRIIDFGHSLLSVVTFFFVNWIWSHFLGLMAAFVLYPVRN
ncbi:hypothetical protein LEP1GSC161_0004 [Leptospira santarosai str. CBC1416]|uniref:Uncharacterized protein n=1 Tax=Leptospira santarosai str. CBC1416 TaxID=1193059 RepID=M6VQF1_9LEPT|nr:hypothetical protein LEP1GSC161_0004 [Leptospira santarosai str. CBC1416]